MKKFLFIILSLVIAAAIYLSVADTGTCGSGNCILCEGGGQCSCNDSNCSQSDTQECAKLGCKRTGTASCSSAANVKKYR